jgi:hypothetical protein
VTEEVVGVLDGPRVPLTDVVRRLGALSRPAEFWPEVPPESGRAEAYPSAAGAGARELATFWAAASVGVGDSAVRSSAGTAIPASSTAAAAPPSA